MLKSTPSLFQSIRSFWIYHVLISGFFVSIECTLVVPPDHVIVLLNQEARITCTTDLDYSVVWFFASTKPGGPSRDIYSDGEFHPIVQDKYNIDNSIRGRHDLLIEKSDPDHAGRYECRDKEGLGDSGRLTAEFIVLDHEPHCRVFWIEGERFIRCNVSHTGNLIPTIRCSSTPADVVREGNLISVQISSTTEVHRCTLCFQTPDGECVIRTVTMDTTYDGAPNMADLMTEERSSSMEVDWLSKQDTTTAIIAVFGTIAAVFLALAVIRTVLYCLKYRSERITYDHSPNSESDVPMLK